MSEPVILSWSALGLIFLLGLRHGLDPDHIAVIDGLTFRAAAERPRLSPWVGTMFAVGHSLSVAIVAIGAGALAKEISWPDWIGDTVDWLVIALLALTGWLNLRALRPGGQYVPLGWRRKLVPRGFGNSTHPGAIVAIGAIFGMVFDTATQAAAWGAAATAHGGEGAIAVAAAFTAGMVLTDTADSFVVARLLRKRGSPADVGNYRRGVGWVIVSLSFGMAAYTLVAKVHPAAEMPEQMFSTMGVVMVLAVIGTLLLGNPAPKNARPGNADGETARNGAVRFSRRWKDHSAQPRSP